MQHKSRSYTLAMWSFVASIIFIFFGLIEHVAIGDVTIKLRSVSSEIILFLLGPSFGLYGFRRFTEAKYYREELHKEE